MVNRICSTCGRTGDNHQYCKHCKEWFCVYHINPNHHECNIEYYKNKKKDIKRSGGSSNNEFIEKTIKRHLDDNKQDDFTPGIWDKIVNLYDNFRLKQEIILILIVYLIYYYLNK